MPEPYKADFKKQVTYTNLSRIRIPLLILLGIQLVLVIMNLQQGGLLSLDRGYQRLFILHLVLICGLLVFIILSQYSKPLNPAGVAARHRVIWISFVLFVLAMGAAISANDQLIHGEITVYLISAFAVAAGVYLGPVLGLVGYGSAYLILMIGITLYQQNRDELIGNYVNGTVLTVIAFLLTRITYRAFRRQFINQRIIEEQNARLERQSREDGLTGLYNRRYLEERILEEFDRSKRYRHPLTIAMADIDHFKSINDNFSHQVGDGVLQRIAKILKANLRSIDVVSRYGGEEFLIIFPETPLENASIVCEKNRLAIEGYPWETLDPQLRVTMSFGLADISAHNRHESMISTADAKLYEAKHLGRNRVCW